MGKTAQIALHAAQDRLKVARKGLEQMKIDPQNFWIGIQNICIFGRMVTFQLQNMKNTALGFNDWYDAEIFKIKYDKQINYFKDLRNRIEKQATTAEENLFIKMTISNLNTAEVDKIIQDCRPPGATNFLYGAPKYGGANGWVLNLDEDEEAFFVVSLPKEYVDTKLFFATDGKPLTELEAVEAAQAYIDWLSKLVKDADTRFSN